jgi:hypothetical protein
MITTPTKVTKKVTKPAAAETAPTPPPAQTMLVERTIDGEKKMVAMFVRHLSPSELELHKKYKEQCAIKGTAEKLSKDASAQLLNSTGNKELVLLSPSGELVGKIYEQTSSSIDFEMLKEKFPKAYEACKVEGKYFRIY